MLKNWNKCLDRNKSPDTLAYGEELTAPYEDSNDKVLNTITYTGHEKDYETNLTYMLARYYSQGYGVFISPDKFDLLEKINSLTLQIEDPQKREQVENLLTNPLYWNKYTYCLDNPTNRVDKNGRFSTIFVIVLVVGIPTIYAIGKWMERERTKAEEGRLIEKSLSEKGEYYAMENAYRKRIKSTLRGIPEVVRLANTLVFLSFPKKDITDDEVKKILNEIRKAKMLGKITEEQLDFAKQEIMRQIAQIERQLQSDELTDEEREQLMRKKQHLEQLYNGL